MHTAPSRLDVVALMADLPSHGLRRGQVGTVVEILGGACEVEFSDNDGRARLGRSRARTTPGAALPADGAASARVG